MIYLDNCATTKPDPQVVEVMVRALEEDFANPSSLHSFGHQLERQREDAREQVARLIGASAEEITFTSGGTESNNIAVHGHILKNKRWGNRIITSSIEHSSILDQFRHYEKEGFEVVYLDVDGKGHIKMEQLLEAINEKTILLSLVHVHNELGTITDFSSITKECRRRNAKMAIHADGVQAAGKIPVDVRELGVDSYSLSSHKIYGPKGAGALYLKRGIQIPSLVIGGGQERGLRSGTENMPGILGFGKACELSEKDFSKRYHHALELKEYFLEKLAQQMDKYQVNTPKDSSPYILSISFEQIRAEVLLHYLETEKIYISTASACSSTGTKKTKTIAKIGLREDLAEGTIRICTCKDTTREELDLFLSALKKYVAEIREIMGR